MGRLRALRRLGVWLLVVAALVAGCATRSANTDGGFSRAAAPAAGTASGSAGETIPVGAIVSVTGPASTLGKPERDTLLMVAEEINAAGGVNGRKLTELV